MPSRTSLPGGFTDPVRHAQDQARAPPDDRVGRVHHVEHPRAVPRPDRPGECRRSASVGEPHRTAVLVDGLDLRAPRVAVVAELAEQRVEVGRTREQGAAVRLRRSYSPLKAVSAAEGPKALPGDVQLGALVLPAASTTGRTPRRTGHGRPPGPSSGRPGRTATTAGRSTGSRRSPSRRALKYSKVSTMAGSTHPLPVVVTTSRFVRWKPPARSRSSTASAARDSVSSADSRPA